VVAKLVTHQSAKLTFMGSSPIHASISPFFQTAG
jgi:hypothetical protein